MSILARMDDSQARLVCYGVGLSDEELRTTISLSSSLASSTPATSSKVTVCCTPLLLWRLPGPRLGSLMGSLFIAPSTRVTATTYICRGHQEAL